MKGFKNKDNDFIPTDDGSKKIHSSKINSSTETSNNRFSSKKKLGIEPLEPFPIREKIRLLDEHDVSQHYNYLQLEDVRNDIDATLSALYFTENPNEDFFSPDVAFKNEGKGSPEFDMLLTERRKVQGAMNRITIRSLSGAEVSDPTPTGFPEIDRMRT